MSHAHAFITGATGFVGQNLLEQLTLQGWDVTALYRPGADQEPLERFHATPVEGDVRDPESLHRAIPDGVDVVFHVAGNTSVWSRRNAQQWRVNVEGTRNLLAAARARNVGRVVHTSTWNVYAPELQTRISEDSPKLGAESWIHYTRSKYAAEKAVHEAVAAGLDAVVVNPGHVIGRYDARAWGRLIRAAARGLVPLAPPGAGSFAHAEAVARAHIAAAEHGRTGANYLLGGADATFLELVREAATLAHRRYVPDYAVPAPLFRLAGRVGGLIGAVTRRDPGLTPEAAAITCTRAHIVSGRAEEELGYEPAGLHDMVADCYWWMRRHNAL